MKCRVCRGSAVIDVPRHNANFCAEHFLRLCRDQTRKAIEAFDMIAPGDRVLVAVSGGKDSLALWQLLHELGHTADGLYIGLGIGAGPKGRPNDEVGYSDVSGEHVRRFAASKGFRLLEIDVREEHGFDIPTAAATTRRVPCSSCGLTKRHLFDRAAIDGGYDVVATGHNLDDEAAVLFGNALQWNTDYLARQAPVLPAGNGFPRKVKPLVRLTERETAAYCVLSGIDYQIEECPLAAGNRHLGYKDLLDQAERRSPGTKHTFYFGFLDRAAERFQSGGEGPGVELGRCGGCGAPTSEETCAFCRLQARVTGVGDVPVRITSTPGVGR